MNNAKSKSAVAFVISLSAPVALSQTIPEAFQTAMADAEAAAIMLLQIVAGVVATLIIGSLVLLLFVRGSNEV